MVYQGNIAGIEAIQLTGAATARFSGEVIDSTGKSRGRGGLTASGPALEIAGSSLGIALTGELRLAGARATFVNPTPRFEVLSVSSTGNVTVSAASVAFTPANAPAPVALGRPVTLVRPAKSGIKIESDGDLQWPNAPSSLRLVSPGRGRSTLSWAGDGVVRADGGEHRATYLGVKAASIDATIERAERGWRVLGNARFLQVYRDGLPVLPAVGRVRVKSGRDRCREVGRVGSPGRPRTTGAPT